jgi:tRNA dimethylallyltransferase
MGKSGDFLEEAEEAKVYIIVGETGSGKTAFALNLAKEIDGEIVNIDLSQVYSFLKIGTGQISVEDRCDIPHHMLGFIEEPILISIFEMRKFIEEKVWGIFSRGKIPILVGGSHFLVLALFFAQENFLNDSEDFYYRSKKFDFCSWFPNSGRTESRIVYCPRFDYRVIALEGLEKEKRTTMLINRIKNFFLAGWSNEVADLRREEKDFVLQRKFIGYPEILDFLHNEQKINLEQLYDSILLKTVQYAKRQRTFLRKLTRHMIESNIPFVFAENSSLRDYGKYRKF